MASGSSVPPAGDEGNRVTLALAPKFTEPLAPDAAPITELHRGNDGFVVFQRRSATGQFESLFSVRASELPELFPEFIAPHVEEESFYGINAVWLHPGETRLRSRTERRFAPAKWGASRLRYLTACYIDLDCYKLGITVGQCIGACIDAQERRAFPPASIITRSGAGVWLFWLLREDDGNGPVRAWPERSGTYRRIQRALHQEFSRLGADGKALDPARITRVPGSLHRKSGRRVAYWLQLDADGKPFSYRLDELAVSLGVRPTRYTPEVRKAVNPVFRERGQRGWDALNRSRLRKLLELFGMRGKIKEGCRNHAALLLACFLHRARVPDDELRSNVQRFGREQCDPPLSEAEIADAITKRKEFRFADFTIGEWLGITPEESASIGWPASGTRSLADDATLRNRSERCSVRRELVRRCIAESGGSVPPLRYLREWLEERMGTAPSTHTLTVDLASLGVENPRRWRRTDSTPELFVSK